jgi:hypothetical protein
VGKGQEVTVRLPLFVALVSCALTAGAASATTLRPSHSDFGAHEWQSDGKPFGLGDWPSCLPSDTTAKLDEHPGHGWKGWKGSKGQDERDDHEGYGGKGYEDEGYDDDGYEHGGYGGKGDWWPGKGDGWPGKGDWKPGKDDGWDDFPHHGGDGYPKKCPSVPEPHLLALLVPLFIGLSLRRR